MKYSILTLIMKGYDIVREVPNPNPDVEYVLVTDDKNLQSKTWKVVYEPLLDNPNIDGIAATMIVKYNAYKYVSNDIFVRIDGSIQIKDDITPLIEEFDKRNADLMVMQHPFRTHFDEEYDLWIKERGLDPSFKKIFYDRMRFTDYDFSWDGLIECTIQIYRKSEKLEEYFNDLLFCLFKDESWRYPDKLDQCYITCLLMTKYHLTLRTWLVADNLLHSKYFELNFHGENRVNETVNWEKYKERADYQIGWWRGKAFKMPLFD